jgi:thymidylate synthase (FAD)
MIDILEGWVTETKIGEHGVVRLLDVMPRLVRPGETLDHAVLAAARVSYGQQEKAGAIDEPARRAADRGLIRYLYRNHHGTPFEMVNLKWYHSLPIFVARQLIRHRMASVNEYSMRYKEPKERAFVPDADQVRQQSKNNKQGTEGQVREAVAADFQQDSKLTAANAFIDYNAAVAAGIGREIARINLPLSTFTEWYWEIDLRNMLQFLALRLDRHAQKEIRDYAEAMYHTLKPLAPWTFEAFDDFTREGMHLSQLEVDAIRQGNARLTEGLATSREQEEYAVKVERLELKLKGRPA